MTRDRIETINRYIKLAGAPEAQRGASSTPRGVMPFVTISRESGAGGQQLAQLLLQALHQQSEPVFQGWQIFDESLCELVAKDEKLSVSLENLLDETSLNAVEDLVSTMVGKSPQRDVHSRLVAVVRELGLVGKAIIVGRGGSAITRDIEPGIHLRLRAPLAVRVERKRRQAHGKVNDVEKWVVERDRARRTLVKRLCREEIDDPLLYDVTWNTESVPLEVIANSVVDWIRRSHV